MPFITDLHLGRAVGALKGAHAVSVLILPAMRRAGVPVTTDPQQGAEYGSADEIALLKEYFSVAGAPDESKPFRAVWEDQPNRLWRDPSYPGRSCQAMRKERAQAGVAFLQAKNDGGKDRWALKPTAGRELVAQDVRQVRAVDLAIWYGREQEVDSLDSLVAWFLEEFGLEAADLIGTAYDRDVPADYAALPLAPQPITAAELADVVGALHLAEPYEEPLPDLVGFVERALSAARFVVPPGFVQRIIRAWLSNEMVVLVGPGGTGKTMFADLLARAVARRLPSAGVHTIPVDPDFDASQFLGYERLDTTVKLQPFAEHVVRSESPFGAHIVVIDEVNLAEVEQYMSGLLTAMEHPHRIIRLPDGETAVPVDVFVLATANSPLDEPETRHFMSSPAKRRFSVLHMPNMLFEEWRRDRTSVARLAVERIAAEAEVVLQRQAANRATSLDQLRLSRLQTVQGPDDLSMGLRERLMAVCDAVLATGTGRYYFTLSVLRDVALKVAYADRREDAELAALGEAFEEDVLQLLRGPKAILDPIVDAIGDVPNAEAIRAIAERMRDVPGDDIVNVL